LPCLKQQKTLFPLGSFYNFMFLKVINMFTANKTQPIIGNLGHAFYWTLWLIRIWSSINFELEWLNLA
jgi:hypothetical protein